MIRIQTPSSGKPNSKRMSFPTSLRNSTNLFFLHPSCLSFTLSLRACSLWPGNTSSLFPSSCPSSSSSSFGSSTQEDSVRCRSRPLHYCPSACVVISFDTLIIVAFASINRMSAIEPQLSGLYISRTSREKCAPPPTCARIQHLLQ